MNAHLGRGMRPLKWLFEPSRPVSARGRVFLLSQLLVTPSAALMGSFGAIIVLLVANLRSSSILFDIFLVLECFVALVRIIEWRLRPVRLARSSSNSISIDLSVLLSFSWCTLQGVVAFTILRGGDPVLEVLSTSLIMGLLGPICARNYAAPRFSILLVLLCGLPFVGGAVLNSEPMLSVIVLMTPPWLFGATLIVTTFHDTMLSTLEAEDENKRLALHDPLTGALNRRGMDDALQGIDMRQGKTMALLSIDLDGFKQVNDMFGHGAGDCILVEVVQRIKRNVRETDLVARMGGDEFMIVLRNMGLDAIPSAAEGLISAISDQPIAVSSDVAVPIGASIGYACLPQDATTTLELRSRADRALYDAKDAGKGIARRYQPGAQVGQRRDNSGTNARAILMRDAS